VRERFLGPAPVSRLLATLFAFFGLGIAVFGWFFALFNCDEGCDDSTQGATAEWWETATSTEWDLIAYLGSAFALAALATAVLVFRGARTAAIGAVGAAVALAIPFASLVDTASSNSGADLILWLIAGLIVGLVATLSTTRRARRGDSDF
jgi:hypothetical protein